MSAREDQPATVPPPAGEDDAYNAATKVGAMPAEVMARLRAEGLLPEEGMGDPSNPPAPPLPATPVPRPTPPVSTTSSAPPMVGSEPPDYDPLPVLDTEDRYGETGLPQIHLETPINELRSESQMPVLNSSRPPLPMLSSQPPALTGPPLGFPSAPPASGSGFPTALQSSGMQVPSLSQVPPPPPISEPALQREVRAFGGTRLSKAQRIIVLVVALAGVVAFAFLMALLSQRR